MPIHVKEKKQRTFRSINVNSQEIEFSSGFTDLHTLSYQEILKGNGFGLNEAKSSVGIVHTIRNQAITQLGEKHEFLKGWIY